MTVKIELFSSPACGKCDQVKKKIADIADRSGGEIEFVVVNILEQMDYALQLGVLSTRNRSRGKATRKFGKLQSCKRSQGLEMQGIGLPTMDELHAAGA